jgi:ribonucleoside-diphosphate reductase alpha subunit
MRVRKRDGEYQTVDFNKISDRIQNLIVGTDANGVTFGDALEIDANVIAKDVCGQIIDGISTWQLDEFAAELCAYKGANEHAFDILASRIIISNHHKKTEKYRNFSDMIKALYENVDVHGLPSPLIADAFYEAVMKHKDRLNEAVNRNHNRDYESLDYFGFKTLEKGYLLKIKNSSEFIQERYQHLLMREAFNMYMDDPDSAIESYEQQSQSMFTHATPTKFNSGTRNPQLSSCFLSGMVDSIDGMYECIRRLSHVSKWAGGIGIWLSKIRASGSMIRGTNGESSGLVPLAKVLNEFAQHVNQGGKRKGSVALYLEPWHGDIFEFLNMKKNHGAESLRARELFYALWIPDIFMRRVKRALLMKRVTGSSNIKWSLMCPDECPGLPDCHSDEFDELYTKYEKEGRYRKQIDILVLWQAILDAHKEMSLPYMCYKDHVNNKSNQKNHGIIRSSNLCAEIMQYSDQNEMAVCNLASINLKKMVTNVGGAVKLFGKGIPPEFNFHLLHQTAKQVTKNLNRVIDISKTPVSQAKRSNFLHRAIGQGVQGLADAFILMGLPFESEQAQELNKKIFETINHGANEQSMELARDRTRLLQQMSNELLKQLKEDSAFIDYYENHFYEQALKEQSKMGVAYDVIDDMFKKDLEIRQARAQKIISQFGLNPQISEYQYMNLDLEHRDRIGAYSTFVGSPASQGQLCNDLWGVKPSGMWDFDQLRSDIKRWGLRNSLLIAVMPTATTAQILGSTECIEPVTSNIYARGVLSGTFLVVNRYLQKELSDLGLWSSAMKDKILMNNGSIQDIDEIPDQLKLVFKTAWEMSKKTLIKMSADRGAWIDQSQSFNHFISDPTDDILSSVHMYAWEQGLKTGMYYLRRQTLVDPQKFSIDINKHKQNLKNESSGSMSLKKSNSSKAIEQLSTQSNKGVEDPCSGGGCAC